MKRSDTSNALATFLPANLSNHNGISRCSNHELVSSINANATHLYRKHTDMFPAHIFVQLVVSEMYEKALDLVQERKKKTKHFSIKPESMRRKVVSLTSWVIGHL